MGRKKQERSTTGAVAGAVLAKVKAEELWLKIIALEKRRLGIDQEDGEPAKGGISGPDYPGKYSIIPLVNTLRYLECRAFGDPHVTVNHLHDKPIELTGNLTVSLAETIQKARKRVNA